MVSHSEVRLDALITIVDYYLENTLMNVYKKNNVPILLLTYGKAQPNQSYMKLSDTGESKNSFASAFKRRI